ncbi:hybrid sensor histidine kinase/response regulator [Paenibacillus turpanensis]|uniref:hybrid sensor histidine kinase/response regulator n=1 Tax=Paenibacillus turpanensis TaxID=2689078 RepID=UPI00140D18AB|nr:ATP-binding protein [Paenibacillus turpanensis]
MLRKRKVLMLLLGLGIAAFLALYYIGQAYLSRSMQTPQVRDGVIDLTEWDFTKEETVKLQGSWQFYWNQLLLPNQEGERTGYLNVPGQWNRDGYPAKGAVTYRMLVKVKPSSMIYGMRVSNVQMASAVYVNGVELGRSGQPAMTKNEYKPENKPYTLYFPIEGDTAEIILHAANFDFINGGITYNIHFGSMKAINHLDKRITGLDVLVVMALGLIGLYHLGIFLKRRQEKSLLYFGLYCIVAAFAFGCLSDKLFIQIFYWLPFELSHKLQLIVINGSIIMLALFIRTLCSTIVPAWFFRSVFIIYGLFSLFGALVPFQIYSHFTFIFSALQVVVYVSVIWMLSASKENRYGNYNRQSIIILILGFYALLICLIDNSLYILGQLPNNYLGNFSTMAFAFLISMMLSFRFSDAYKTIETMTEKLLESDRLKDEFLINTSHELQTPLNGILNISQSMLEEAGGSISEKQHLNLIIVQESARRLSALVGDILDMERIKRNDLLLHMAAVDVRVTVSIVLEVAKHLASGKEIRIVNRIPEDLPPVHADENRLRQILLNLIGNAIKFTDQGEVEIIAEPDGDRMKIIVQDSGIGIALSDWKHVFEPFNQAEGERSQGYGGVGLGLSISRQLVHLMDGDIFIERSEPGVGTRIAFVLPVSEARSAPVRLPRKHEMSVQPAQKEPLNGGDSKPGVFTLLAVDDEESNLQVLRNLFAGEEYSLYTAANGREALRILQTNRTIDLVLLDVMMPQLSGYEVCREIRSKHTLFDLPVIILTVRSTPQDIAAGLAAGANDFIAKPFNAVEVRARVKTLLELKKSVRDAMDAEMAFLQAQIKPHFLYNALSSVISFCYSDGEKAAFLLSRLSQYLRHILDMDRHEMLVPLSREMELIEAYVDIEKARFDDSFEFVSHVEEGLRVMSIPSLCIQPFVENAIRHGLFNKGGRGTVTLTVKSDADAVEVTIEDDGAGMPEDILLRITNTGASPGNGAGIGIRNVQRRLDSIFGASLKVASGPDWGTRITMRIPTDTGV